jgi:hypothetical protein
MRAGQTRWGIEMTNALLIDVDKRANPKLRLIPNLALMQISGSIKKRGGAAGFDIKNPDIVYISCIFSKNAGLARELAHNYVMDGLTVSLGGSGVNDIWLPENMQKALPDYDLYHSTYSQGFTTRGCPNKCGFCIVPRKEGKLQIWQHPDEFHDPRFNTCMIMDNNLFAAPNSWQGDIYNWFIRKKIKMLSPQGWDIRLLNDWRARALKEIKHAGSRNVHFAWDNMKDETAVINGIEILKNHKFNLRQRIMFYVLCGYGTTIEEDVYRCQKLKELGVRAYAMRYKQTPEINALARWTARAELFWKFDFKDYDRRKK